MRPQWNQIAGWVRRHAVRVWSRSTAITAAARAAPSAIRVICQPGMPPVTTGWAVAWTGGAADALDLFVPPAPTEHASGGHRPAPGGVGLLEEDGRRRRGLQLPRPLGRLGDLSDHLAHGLVLRFEGDIGLGYHANKQVVIVHDRQPPHLMLCHQVKRV